MSDKESSRKRSKTSRACDECRRKKVKCDASFNKITNNLEASCTQCHKNKEICTFERTPLKRGPSKGYSKIQVQPSQQPPQMSSLSPTGLPEYKRNYSASSLIPPLVDKDTMKESNGGGSAGTVGGTPGLQLPSIDTITKPMKGFYDDMSQQFHRRSSHSRHNSDLSQSSHAHRVMEPSPITSPVTNLESVPATSTGTSPQSTSPLNANPGISGPFWKVPYPSITRRRGSNDSLNSFSSDYSSKSLGNIANSSDEFKTAPGTKPSSPANSFSSLSSINQLPSSSSSPTYFLSSKNVLNTSGPSSNSGLGSAGSSGMGSGSAGGNGNGTGNGNGNGNAVKSTLADQMESNLTYYYQEIHPVFPLVPMHRQDLDKILNTMPPTSVNMIIGDSFFKVLQVLVTVLKKEDINIINPLLENSSGNGRSRDSSREVFLVKDIVHPFITQLFQIYPTCCKSVSEDNYCSVILHLITLNFVNYVIVISGEDSDFSFNLTLSVFSDLGISKKIKNGYKFGNEAEKVYYKLFVIANFLSNIYSLSFGQPNSFASIPFKQTEILVNQLMPESQSLKVGLVLSDISKVLSENFELNVRKLIEIYEHFEPRRDVCYSFLTFIVKRAQLQEILSMCPVTASKQEIDEYQNKLCHTCSSVLFQNIELLQLLSENGTFNLGSKQKPVQSPLMPLVFIQSSIMATLIKILVNSMGFNKDLLSSIQKILSDIMLLNNYVPQIKPFNDLNNYGTTHDSIVNNSHNKFEFNSSHLTQFLEVVKLGGYTEYRLNSYITGLSVLEQFGEWRLLMLDIKGYLHKQDMEGWLLK